MKNFMKEWNDSFILPGAAPAQQPSPFTLPENEPSVHGLSLRERGIEFASRACAAP